jgi:hypothetical protein
MLIQQPFEGLTQVLEYMKAIRNLYRIRRTTSRSGNVIRCAIATDDLDAGVVFQPLCECLGRTILQEVYGLVPFKIHQDGAVALAFA